MFDIFFKNSPCQAGDSDRVAPYLVKIVEGLIFVKGLVKIQKVSVLSYIMSHNILGGVLITLFVKKKPDELRPVIKMEKSHSF